MTVPEFIAYPKTPRLFRDMVITEKIDGTNAAVRITDDGAIWAQSRNRLITPDDDNFGFATWVVEHAEQLTSVLGPGLHFGEWWGSGIQRGYGLTEKRFSLFNAKRWEAADLSLVPGLHLVPVLSRHTFNTHIISDVLHSLATTGSQAAPGFMHPEGVIVYHGAANQVFKVLLDNDNVPKGLAA
jgi:hypothetical protein